MRSPAASFDLRAALSQEITQALAAFNAAPLEPAAVHRCRVHLKRARSLARIGRDSAPGLSRVFNDAARAVMHSLAQARDLNALAETARALAARKKKAGIGLLHLAEALDEQRASLPPLEPEAVRAGLNDLIALAQELPEVSARQLEKGVSRIAKRAREACKEGHGSDAPTRRHTWRKREKDRFYTAILLGKAWPLDRRRRRKLGERLGHALGQERDTLLLIERLEAEPSLAGRRRDAHRALAVLHARRDRLAERADALGLKLHRRGA